MAKVVKIEDDRVLVGTDDGCLKEITKEAFGFVPAVGDEIEIFENDNRMAVLKKAPAVTSEQPAQQSGAININVSNSIEGQNQAAAYVPSSKSTKVVNKIVYCLLAFFLGGLGFHRFYAGKIGTGILYLLFCWTFIPSLLALIDFIIGLCKRSDSNGNIAV